MCSYCKKHDETEVPDPYYGGPQGFEKVIYVYRLAYERWNEISLLSSFFCAWLGDETYMN